MISAGSKLGSFGLSWFSLVFSAAAEVSLSSKGSATSTKTIDWSAAWSWDSVWLFSTTFGSFDFSLVSSSSKPQSTKQMSSVVGSGFLAATTVEEFFPWFSAHLLNVGLSETGGVVCRVAGFGLWIWVDFGFCSGFLAVFC